jgi:hypothetical protein
MKYLQKLKMKMWAIATELRNEIRSERMIESTNILGVNREK